ncbi:arginyl-tRNA synthetase [Coemansia spiralis]|uniref:arginine--tRNA ligase n=1 Tax=Coemansia spiralis TaxID=417178 RepID=A0A9W8G3J6_9FUNG|nr:arginyl-tRNA synthetase [Coemansia spiralis]
MLSKLSGVSAEIIVSAIDLPKATTYGDLIITMPRLRLVGNPAQLAQSFAEKFKTDEAVTSVVATGYCLNFRVNRTTFIHNVLSTVHREGNKYGWTNEGTGKRAIVEFSSPNTAKPFHAGHLRSTIIGNFIYNLYKANDWDAISMNYLDDWGKQYSMLAIGFSRFGSEEKLAANPIIHLHEIYVAIHAEASKDPSIHDEPRLRDISIVKYNETYARLNIKFDNYSGESLVGKGMEKAIKMLEDAGLIVENNVAKIIELAQCKLEEDAVVQKSDEITLYLTRDVGAAIEHYEKYKFDKIIYVVSSRQGLYFKQLFKTLELLKLPYADRFQHINYGVVKGMSTRKGTAVFLNDMLMECKANMQSHARERQKDMSARRIKDYDFDWTRILSLEGDIGPYLQHAHTHLCSLEHKSNPVNLDADVSILTEETAREIVTLISRYPDVLSSTIQTLEPCTVVQYILKLSHAISAAWEAIMVHDQPQDIADARLLMYSSARIVLGNALIMLGLDPVQCM